MSITRSDFDTISRRVQLCDYLSVAQIFLAQNFFLDRDLSSEDIKPRLLGHWGTCHGINIAYANLHAAFAADPQFTFVLGPGHGFPALQANLLLDGELAKINSKATFTRSGIEYICRNFSWPGGFPSHASPVTPHVICEGGELGYALATAYGAALGHPEKTVAVLIGDGEFETATTLASLNLPKLFSSRAHGRVIPILHLNGYKISAPTLAARTPEADLEGLLSGFGYQPYWIHGDQPEVFQSTLQTALHQTQKPPFLILQTTKGATGPLKVRNRQIANNYLAHQVPLPNAKTDLTERQILATWLKSYNFSELFRQFSGDSKW